MPVLSPVQPALAQLLLLMHHLFQGAQVRFGCFCHNQLLQFVTIPSTMNVDEPRGQYITAV